MAHRRFEFPLLAYRIPVLLAVALTACSQTSAPPTAETSSTPAPRDSATHRPTNKAEWERASGAAEDIGIGPDGSIWVIGRDKKGAGGGIYRRTGETWTNIPGRGIKIAVDPKGNPWVVTAKFQIYRYDGSTFSRLPGEATDVGIGSDGTAWVVGTPQKDSVYRRVGKRWERFPVDDPLRVAVDGDGNAWVTTSRQEVLKFNGRSWDVVFKSPGRLFDIATANNGVAWVVTSAGIFRWDASALGKTTGHARNVAVAPDGKPWVATDKSEIYRWVGSVEEKASPGKGR
jgi:hypothetical protein